MTSKRIVSFLPSATELLFALGVQDNLVGVTHECNFPQEAKTKPRVITSIFESNKMTSRQIDEKIQEVTKNNQDMFIIDEDILRGLNPDLIIAQGTCAVCAAHTNEVNKALAILEQRPQVEMIDPHNIKDILASVIQIAKAVNRKSQGEQLVYELQKRIDRLKSKTFTNKPRVLCIEWVEPFFTAGHWVPQMVEIAGGINLLSATGQHSKRISMDVVEASEADIIVMMPCGFDTKRTIKEYTHSLQNNQQWKNLRAVKNKAVYAVDANSYFSKPSIRIVTGIEILAKILHPEEFTDLNVPIGSFVKLET